MIFDFVKRCAKSVSNDLETLKMKWNAKIERNVKIFQRAKIFFVEAFSVLRNVYLEDILSPHPYKPTYSYK